MNYKQIEQVSTIFTAIASIVFSSALIALFEQKISLSNISACISISIIVYVLSVVSLGLKLKKVS